MTARPIGRPNPTSQARLQLLLILLAAWDLLAFGLTLVNRSLLEIGEVDGILAGRAYAGTTAVLAIAYVYAARNPVRNRFVLWLASLEQFVAIFSYGWHRATGDVNTGEVLLPIAVSAIFLVLLIMYLPRQTDSI
jgi:hypothetical protein